MAQFDFHGSWEDSRSYLERLVRLQRFTFVVNKAYTSPVPYQFSTVTDETWAIVQQRPNLYLRSEEYSRFAPSFGAPVRGSMRISQVHSGPALELSLPYCSDRSGNCCLGLGILMYQPLYQDPETGEWFKPPESLKRAFGQVRTLLRQDMAKRYLRVQTVRNGIIRPEAMILWIGCDAMAALEAGTAQLCLGRELVPLADLAKTPSELPPVTDEEV
jgi:hypothetical protein